MGALALTGVSTAQTPPGTTMEKTEVREEKGPGPDTKTKKVTVVGVVKDDDPGDSITIEVKGKNKKFDLNGKDTTATVVSTVAVGTRVTVVDKTDDQGNHVISVEPNTDE